MLRTLLGAYFAAGGSEPPVLLIHHPESGGAMIDMLARQGDGLPARVIPVASEMHWGLDAFASALAFGAAELVVLVPPRDAARQESMQREMALLGAVTEGLGYGSRLHMLVCGDCWSFMRSVPTRGRKSYICARYKEYGTSACSRNTVYESNLWGSILGAVQGEILSPERLDAIAEILPQVHAAKLRNRKLPSVNVGGTALLLINAEMQALLDPDRDAYGLRGLVGAKVLLVKALVDLPGAESDSASVSANTDRKMDHDRLAAP